MHRMLIGIGVAAVALTAGMQATEAQTPFGSRPYCWSGDRSSGGMASCSFYTWEQCRANVVGGGSHCYPNPLYAGDRGQGKQKPQKRQKSSAY